MAKEHLLHKQFSLPGNCHKDCKTVVMRELDGDDDILIATWLDQQPSSLSKDASPGALMVEAMKREQHESVRCSIVSVDGKRVGENGTQFPAFDKWRRSTHAALLTFFNQLNGVGNDELGKALKEAAAVDPATLQPLAANTAGTSPGG